MLQWTRSQDPPCDWDEYVCSNAAQNGHLFIIQYARAQDPPCDWDMTVYAEKPLRMVILMCCSGLDHKIQHVIGMMMCVEML